MQKRIMYLGIFVCLTGDWLLAILSFSVFLSKNNNFIFLFSEEKYVTANNRMEDYIGTIFTIQVVRLKRFDIVL